jgi:hypothetical protein
MNLLALPFYFLGGYLFIPGLTSPPLLLASIVFIAVGVYISYVDYKRNYRRNKRGPRR